MPFTAPIQADLHSSAFGFLAMSGTTLLSNPSASREIRIIMFGSVSIEQPDEGLNLFETGAEKDYLEA